MIGFTAKPDEPFTEPGDIFDNTYGGGRVIKDRSLFDMQLEVGRE